MIRLGMLDFDTSHSVAFTQRFNHSGVPEDQFVDGAKVVIGCPGESVLAPYVGASAYDHGGRRVVEGQRAIQAASDVFLGWASGDTRHAYVRQLRDMKLSPDLTRLDRPSFDDYARLCGRTLARAHARTGDPVAISAYLDDGDEFARAMGSFAIRYADITNTDHAALEAAIADGTVTADRDH